MKRTICALCAGLLVAAAAVPALATNGMNMIGYNVRSSGMGGADVAVDTDCSGTACNPATLGGQRDRSATAGISLLMPQLSESGLANPGGVDGEDQIFPLPYLAYASRLGENSPWTLGFELFAQGGMGVDFNDVNTVMGTVDDYSSQVRYGRLTGAASYRASDRLALGLSVMVGYADMEFALFPDTYSMGMDMTPGTADDFPGMDVEGLSSFGLAGRVGAQYKVSDMVSLGFQYTSETALSLDGGDATFNFGMAKATYEAEMDDFTWPQEFEFGVAVQASPQLLLAVDAKWINWANAVERPILKASNPDIPAPPMLEVPFDMNWDDQWVFAVGAEYLINANHIVRAGYNYGKSPVPDENLSPLFPAIVENHVTLGYGYTTGKWAFDFAYEHAFENEQTNPSAVGNPFGPGVTVAHSQNTLHFALTYFY